ncbi:hydantoinase/oxoprolinase family protein [Nitratireductor aquibiodomus]|uniref:hydantoinase/oxoprolinase family protein n=1 Tax=Nitratireductor TaxID=245876 RepID=UPI0019D3759E|nr:MULTISPECIES: hydantoinase/oxoprolinase family protein [Nitratireductor]MBN7760344.1 hydantoinase/oxoprolinase family protein [Nitratireductor aquibiodomus]MDJ1464568.1 hydantoinase/oxoprolinase family protein [Nitratireductor sp. GZWM139]MDV2965621.1 hydantoinase/oxoprolinase family protein [Nitratireductor aquimarinus]
MTRLAIDIGGTFTDVVLEREGAIHSHKLLTTPAAPEEAALEGSAFLVSELGLSFADVRTVIHGTTLATNALIERRGAKTAFITTEGFRDILEMAYEKRFEQYDTDLQLPQALVPRELRFTLRERIAADGRVLAAPDREDVRALAARLCDEGVEAVAVGFLHATVNPAHEKLVHDWLREDLPAKVTICLSCEVSPEIREYERFSTTCANAYVRPLMAHYLHRFDAALRERGFAGQFMLMLSGGGLTTLEQAARIPIRLVESGPAGGVALGARVARETDEAKLLAFDMGGTTAKICFLEDAVPATTRRFEVARAWRDIKGSGLPVRVPTTELVEIGAGGGSIARRDALGRLAVGPESASSVPGPACYALGGAMPAITDANVVLGKIRPEGFAGGKITLQPELATAAIEEHVATPLGLSSAEWAAAGILEVGEEAMANAARVHAIEQGKDVTRYTIMASGGAGPLHAVRIAEKLGIARVIIPTFAGVGSALGFLSAPVAYEVARSTLAPMERLDLNRLAMLQEEMRREASAVVLPALAEGEPATISLAAELRYSGQGHALRVPLEKPLANPADAKALEQAFITLYRDTYGTVLENNPVELVALSLICRGPAAPLVEAPAADAGKQTTIAGTVKVFDPVRGEFVESALVPREGLAPGQPLPGPALVSEAQTTAYVPTGWAITLHPFGHVILDREVRP